MGKLSQNTMREIVPNSSHVSLLGRKKNIRLKSWTSVHLGFWLRKHYLRSQSRLFIAVSLDSSLFFSPVWCTLIWHVLWIWNVWGPPHPIEKTVWSVEDLPKMHSYNCAVGIQGFSYKFQILSWIRKKKNLVIPILFRASFTKNSNFSSFQCLEKKPVKIAFWWQAIFCIVLSCSFSTL
jgi:hypothetical protein